MSRGAEPTPGPDRAESPSPSLAPRRSPDAPPPRGAAGSIDPAASLAEQIEAAAESGSLEIVTLDGESSDSVELKLQKTAAPPPAVQAPAPSAPEAPSPPKDEPLALDLGPPPSGAALPDPQLGRGPGGALSDPQRGRGPAPPGGALPGPQLGTGPALPDPSARPSASGAFAEAPREPAPPEPAPVRRLFSRDPLANYLFGVAVGLVIGVVAAFQTSRALDREDIMALEDKLAESYVKPIEVEAGELQRPQDIERDLEAMYGDTRTFFLLTMIFAGIPLGLGLGRIRLG